MCFKQVRSEEDEAFHEYLRVLAEVPKRPAEFDRSEYMVDTEGRIMLTYPAGLSIFQVEDCGEWHGASYEPGTRLAEGHVFDENGMSAPIQQMNDIMDGKVMDAHGGPGDAGGSGILDFLRAIQEAQADARMRQAAASVDDES